VWSIHNTNAQMMHYNGVVISLKIKVRTKVLLIASIRVHTFDCLLCVLGCGIIHTSTYSTVSQCPQELHWPNVPKNGTQDLLVGIVSYCTVLNA
jgi:hypothetical protein